MFGPLVAKPGSYKKHKTGSWRGRKKPQFLKNKCVKCGLCKTVCPDACIKGSRTEFYQFDADYCKGCGLCASVCPKNDIVMTSD